MRLCGLPPTGFRDNAIQCRPPSTWEHAEDSDGDIFSLLHRRSHAWLCQKLGPGNLLLLALATVVLPMVRHPAVPV